MVSSKGVKLLFWVNCSYIAHSIRRQLFPCVNKSVYNRVNSWNLSDSSTSFGISLSVFWPCHVQSSQWALPQGLLRTKYAQLKSQGSMLSASKTLSSLSYIAAKVATDWWSSERHRLGWMHRSVSNTHHILSNSCQRAARGQREKAADVCVRAPFSFSQTQHAVATRTSYRASFPDLTGYGHI